MDRTITVRGTGTVKISPDLTVVSMTVKSIDKNYDKAMQKAACMLDELQKKLAETGFSEKDIKTVNFNVTDEHESVRDKNGNYKSIFKGYCVIHSLKLEFDFDTAVLSKVLSTVSDCISEPELSVRFTVKDKDAVREALLRDAAQNAKTEAKILADASGVKLCELVSIDYGRKEFDVYSDTSYGMTRKCMAMANSADMSFNPDDIKISDSAAFVWKIE